jgi:hypothetical protein
MNDIPNFGEPPSNYRSTSRKSAKKFEVKFGTKCYNILQYIKSTGAKGAAAFEIERDLNLVVGGVCSVLHKEDYVRSQDNDEKYQRLNENTNHHQLIWYAKEHVDPNFGKHGGFEYLMVSSRAIEELEEQSREQHVSKSDIIDHLLLRTITTRSEDEKEFFSLPKDEQHKLINIYKYLKLGKIEIKSKGTA